MILCTLDLDATFDTCSTTVLASSRSEVHVLYIYIAISATRARTSAKPRGVGERFGRGCGRLATKVGPLPCTYVLRPA